ncbi:MAG: HIT family hydrolase [Candidatus Latescibacterota bacterium]|nr:MAG: HIT family hydrolase [Candidatus Latescibacterota bacterium]
MKRLWAPWRMEYIAGLGPDDRECIFCEKPRKNQDEKNLILWRGKSCFAMLNLFPYNTGHLLIAPYRHIAQLGEFSQEERLQFWELVEEALRALRVVMEPDGFNLGMNLGRAAGAGIDSHLHLHIVPRWNGDTNFMPVLDDTKVISESLKQTYRKLKPEFFKRSEPRG